jgi:hypothetical protein
MILHPCRQVDRRGGGRAREVNSDPAPRSLCLSCYLSLVPSGIKQPPDSGFRQQVAPCQTPGQTPDNSSLPRKKFSGGNRRQRGSSNLSHRLYCPNRDPGCGVCLNVEVIMHAETCPVCKGCGKVEREGGDGTVFVVFCHGCKGTGWVTVKDNECWKECDPEIFTTTIT